MVIAVTFAVPAEDAFAFEVEGAADRFSQVPGEDGDAVCGLEVGYFDDRLGARPQQCGELGEDGAHIPQITLIPVAGLLVGC